VDPNYVVVSNFMMNKSTIFCEQLTATSLGPKTIKEKVVKRKLPGRHFVCLADNNMSAVTYFIAL